MTAFVADSNVLCAIGRGTEQVWAAARGGLARIGSSHVMDRHFEAIQMGLVPEEALGTLTPEVESLPLPARARRMLQLAAPTLAGLDVPDSTSVAVFLGLPELTPQEAPWLVHFPRYLQLLTDVPIDTARSQVVPRGRAAALMALELALQELKANPSAPVIVGGVDTFLDLRLLATLDAEGRILGPRVMDGFIPGEGAAFITLNSTSVKSAPSVSIDAAASVVDPGHRYGTAPARGEGLAISIQQLRQQRDVSSPVAVTFAGFNGESFDAKLWGVAHLRHSDFFSPTMRMEHPADTYGDAGAATGAILTALASHALVDGARNGPALVWAASDSEMRACALLSRT